VIRGENAGHSLKHVAVTRVLRQVRMIDLHAGSTNDITIAIPSNLQSSAKPGHPSDLRLIAFVQDPDTGRILAVAAGRI